MQIGGKLDKAYTVYIDDEEYLLEIFKMDCEDLDVPVMTFSDPVKAIEFCHSNEVAIVITDFRMPKINGLELLKSLKSPCPRYILTGELNFSIKEINDQYFKKVLYKPLSENEFKAVILEAYES